ncbi:MAG TPA: pyridoxamine 5'-phosphate oxidase family protein [Acidisoma sp.]|jgi:predicted pyridoxine 5'-phosphate oxidase superfamily flavin-nucleotide-binding protein|uniref:pyridoxamine 5'-phosphate oxidase family protein n=1 Tax=Acidisoma sp. TaxID=1872115 RepID=UPI002B91D563|nr:pyridoxamine 5'-phosphate oxidase family protein [Acidisoma sp.]HTI00844.1 pyridoxamine 5'-phosphate oxidase family protein [Acidisoma sp.]
MSYGFLDALATPGVRAVQAAMGSDKTWANFKGHREFDRIGPQEAAFIAARDSVYMATVGETGWPYVQHRGGRPGFIKVIDEKTLAFPDYRGNLQYISIGNLSTNDRAALILMDYPHRARMKILAHVEIVLPEEQQELAEKVLDPTSKAKVERIILLHLVSFDWNCPQHITPRFTEAEVNEAIEPLIHHVEALKAEVHALREQLASANLTPDSV